MSSTLDIERLAKELGAERYEKVSAHGGYFGALQLAAEVASRSRVSEGKQSNENELLKEICKIAREELQDQERKLELTKTVCECLEAFDRLEQEIGQKTEAVAAKTSEASSATQENEHRKRLGLSQAKLAKLLNVSPNNVLLLYKSYYGVFQLAAEVASRSRVSEGKQSNENELLKEICKIAREELQDQERKLELTKTVFEYLYAHVRDRKHLNYDKRLGLSQAKLAKLLNVSPNNVLMLHRGYFGVLQLLANIASSPRESEGTRSEYRSEFIKAAFEYLRAALKNELEDEGKQLGE